MFDLRYDFRDTMHLYKKRFFGQKLPFSVRNICHHLFKTWQFHHLNHCISGVKIRKRDKIWLEYKKGWIQKKRIFLLFWLHFIIIGFSFVTNRAYQEALSLTGLLQYDANSKILSTAFETLKFSKSDSNVTSSWRHQFSRSSKVDHFPLEMVINYGNFLKSIFEILFLKILESLLT